MSCVVRWEIYAREEKDACRACAATITGTTARGIGFLATIFGRQAVGKAHELLATREKVIEGEYVEMKDAMGSKERDKTKRGEMSRANKTSVYTHVYIVKCIMWDKKKKKTGI